jgi:hypothetical protein
MTLSTSLSFSTFTLFSKTTSLALSIGTYDDDDDDDVDVVDDDDGDDATFS